MYSGSLLTPNRFRSLMEVARVAHTHLIWPGSPPLETQSMESQSGDEHQMRRESSFVRPCTGRLCRPHLTFSISRTRFPHFGAQFQGFPPEQNSLFTRQECWYLSMERHVSTHNNTVYIYCIVLHQPRKLWFWIFAVPAVMKSIRLVFRWLLLSTW